MDYSDRDIQDVVFDICRNVGMIAGFEGDIPDNIKKINSKGFSDGGDSAGLISTAEVLSMITIPYFTMKDFAKPFWEGELISHDVIREGINYLLHGYKNKDPEAHGTHGFGGTPYIDFRYRGDDESDTVEGVESNLDFVDAASFVITALTDLKAIDLHREVLIQDGVIDQSVKSLMTKKDFEVLDRRVMAAFKVIDGANTGPGNGFCYTSEDKETDKIDFVYFTWSVLEMLESLSPYLDNNTPVLPTRLLEKQITNGEKLDVWFAKLKTDKLSFLTGRYLSPSDSPNKYIGNKQIVFEGESGNDTSLFYNIFAVLGLLQTNSEEYEEIAKAVEFIIQEVPKQERNLKKGCSFWLEGDLATTHKIEKEWEERAFEPLYLKTLSLFVIKFANKISPEFLHDVKEAERKLLESLLKPGSKASGRRCSFVLKGDEINSVWDGYKYSIYYTERTMEALCRYYESQPSTESNIPNYSKDIADFYAENESSESMVKHAGGGASPISITIDSNILSSQFQVQLKQEVKKAVAEVKDAIKNDLDQIKEDMKKTIMADLEEEIKEKVKTTFLYNKSNFFEEMYLEIKNARVDKREINDNHMGVLDGVFEAFTALVDFRNNSDNEEVNQKLDDFTYDLVRLLRWDCIKGDLAKEEINETIQRIGKSIEFINEDNGSGEKINFIKTAENLLDGPIGKETK